MSIDSLAAIDIAGVARFGGVRPCSRSLSRSEILQVLQGLVGVVGLVAHEGLGGVVGTVRAVRVAGLPLCSLGV